MQTMYFPKRNRIVLVEIISIIPSKPWSTWKIVIVFVGYNHERNSQSRDRISKVLLVYIFYIYISYKFHLDAIQMLCMPPCNMHAKLLL